MNQTTSLTIALLQSMLSLDTWTYSPWLEEIVLKYLTGGTPNKMSLITAAITTWMEKSSLPIGAAVENILESTLQEMLKWSCCWQKLGFLSFPNLLPILTVVRGQCTGRVRNGIFEGQPFWSKIFLTIKLFTLCIEVATKILWRFMVGLVKES